MPENAAPEESKTERKIFNPTDRLSYEEDFRHPLRLRFQTSCGNQLIRLVCQGIESICPQSDYLMRFWQIKHAENPKQILEGQRGSKDCYDRDENYNINGLFAYFALKIRRPFLQIDGIADDEFPLLSNNNSLFGVPMSPDYTYELMVPLLVFNHSSRSQTIKLLVQETIQMIAY